MKSRIVKIGNSQGIRIPKLLIQQARLGEDVEIQVEGNRLIVGPASRPRSGWAVDFERMARSGDDLLMQADERIPTAWEEAEWEW